MTEEYDYSKDVLPPGGNILAEISHKAEEAIKAEAIVETRVTELKEAKDAYNQIIGRDLPELMKAAGQTTLTTLTKLILKLKNVLRASISEENGPAAFKWLEDNNVGSIIKHALTFDLGKGEKAEKTMDLLAKFADEHKLAYSVKKNVHPQTLQKTLKEFIEAGVDVPFDIFNAVSQDEVTVDKPKVKLQA